MCYISSDYFVNNCSRAKKTVSFRHGKNTHYDRKYFPPLKSRYFTVEHKKVSFRHGKNTPCDREYLPRPAG